jgi:integrase
MTRDRKQTGYIYKKNGWWMLRYREDVVENGDISRKQLSKRIEPVTAQHIRLKRPPLEIERKAAEILQPINNHSYTPEAMQTLEQFVDGVYFPNLTNQKRASTLMGYRARWDSQLRPRCGSYRLRDFRTSDGQRVLADVARQNPSLRRSTLRHLRSLLSGIFKHAIQQGYLNSANPMREVGTPTAPEGEETHAYSLEEVTRMLLYLPEPAYTIAAVAAFTGLRRAELRGLQWENYDGAQIGVTRSVWEGFISEPKTRKSKAPVPVIPALAKILDHHRQLCGNPMAGVMFASTKGTPLNLNNVLNRAILPVLRKAGIEWHGWHAFRRGLATNLNRLGVQDKTIQAILRHANVSTTMNIYVKSVAADSTAAMKLLDGLLCTKCAPDSVPVEVGVVN